MPVNARFKGGQSPVAKTSYYQQIAALSFSKRGVYTRENGEFFQRLKQGNTAQRGRVERTASTEDPKGVVEDITIINRKRRAHEALLLHQ